MTDEERAEVRAKVESLYNSDLTGKEVAKMLGIPEGTVHTWWNKYRKANGIITSRNDKKAVKRSPERKGKHLTTEELEQVKRLLECGMSDRRIAEIVDVNSKSIWRYRRKFGINAPAEPVVIDEERGPNRDRHLCKKCIYRSKNAGKDSQKVGCDYLLHTDSTRMCPVAICDKFKRGDSLSALSRKKEQAERNYRMAHNRKLLKAAIEDRPDIQRILEEIGDKERYGKKSSATIQPGTQDGVRLD